MGAFVEHNFEHNGKENKAAVHDLGAASANLTFEATARGLNVHQMIGIESDKAREVFGISGSLGDPNPVPLGDGAGEIEAQSRPNQPKPLGVAQRLIAER